MFSKVDYNTSGQFWGLSWQPQAHLANCEMIRLCLHAIMHRNPCGIGGKFSGHMWNLSYVVPGDLHTLPSGPKSLKVKRQAYPHDGSRGLKRPRSEEAHV